MARAIVVEKVRLREILHPELVRLAEEVLQEHRREKSLPSQRLASPSRHGAAPAWTPSPAPKLRPLCPHPVTPPPGSLRWMAQGLQLK